MSRIVCVNSNTEVSEYLGLGLEENPNNNLQILQLNGCKFNSKSIVSFARGLRSLKHCLTVLDLSNCFLSSGLNNILDALSMNWGMTIGLEELNISGNQLPSQVGLRFITFISNMRKYSRLRRLSIANTGIDVGMLAIEIAGIEPLQYINLSDNKSNKITSGQLNYLCETTSNLQSIRLASVGLEVETLKRILDALFLNKNLRNINLDLSRNSLGPEGTKTLLPSIKMASNLSGLDLSDNDIREKVGIELFKGLPQSIERLYLNRNFGTIQDTSEFCAAFGSFIATHLGLLVLEVTGASGYRLGVGMDKFFGDLGKNGNIQELDLSGHNFGDEGFAEMCHHLRTNNGLKVLSVDNNNISHSGYKAFYQLLKYNRSLLYLEYPLLDFKRSVDTDKFILILQQIDHLLAMRTPQGRAVKPRSLNPFDFDCLWSTPQNPAQPLFEVPYDLKLISEQLKKDLGEVDDETESNSGTRTPYEHEPTKRKATLLAGSYMARSLVTTEEKVAEDDFDEETTWAELDNVLNAIKEVDPDQFPQTIMEGSHSESPSNSVINVPPLTFGTLPDTDVSQPDSPTRLKKVVTWSKMKSKSAAISSPRKRVGAQRTGTSARLNSVHLDQVDFMDRPEVSPVLTPVSHSTFSAVLTPSTPPPPPITDIYSLLPSVAPPPIDLPLSIPLDSQKLENNSPSSYPANFPPPPQPFPTSYPVALPTVLPPPEDDFSIDHRIKRN
jgi:Ran GTPase-activating protein (RanGAP) involved in mRNA processing and transport